MRYVLITLIMGCFFGSAFAQDKFTINGYVKDAASGEALIGVSVVVKQLSKGTVTNEYGYFSLTLPAGKHDVTFLYVGYPTVTKSIDLTSNQRFDVELSEEAVQLEEVVISSERKDANVTSTEMSVNKLDIKAIEKIPALLGEVDVVRGIQTLPGVSTVGEGATGFNVRGGNVDQNLVLLDEAPVYNSSHLFGFFSVFNPDAVKDVKLIKGGIPSQYGGRLSSILDVRMKEGNKKETAVNGGIGFIFSRLAIESPIVKDKGSFIIAARRSYADVLAKPFLKGDLKDSKFYFYDLTLKANYTLNDKNRLYVSGYLGRDVFGAGFKFNWGNTTTTVRWNRVFSDKLFLNVTGFYSNYDYQLFFGDDKESFDWKAKIKNFSIKPDFTWYKNDKNTIRFGGQTILYQFVPGDATATNDGVKRSFSLNDKYALEHGLYIDNEMKISSRLSMQYGIRGSMFQYIGPGTYYNLNNASEPGLRREIKDTVKLSGSTTIKQYFNPEPRFSVRYQLDSVSSIKVSYNRMVQYIHLVSNTAASTPIDIWTPSTNNIAPQIADQIAGGYFRNFGKNNDFETSVELFYKNMQNQVDYIDGANIFLNETLETDLLNAKGRSYGAEFYVKKNTGKINGWISYTLSRSERQVNGINGGDWYASRFDRLHNLYTVLMYDINKKWSLSANFVFSSGTPATFPTNRYDIQGIVVPHNADYKRNNYRLPAYHRLDFSATMQGKHKEKWESYWVFSIYNVYNRRNPFGVYFNVDKNNPTTTQAIRYSVIGSFIPAVAYNFKF